MKNLICLLFAFFAVSTLSAQENFIQVPGRITQYEATMTSYEKDKDAEAIYIYENGKTFFRGKSTTGRFEVYMEVSLKIKILKQGGLSYGKFEIPYYQEDNNWENVESIEGLTYNYENGELLKSPLDPKNIFTEKINANWNKKVFAMPNVKAGSIIELTYRIISPYLFNIRTWQFQKRIPVVESNFQISLTPYYEYTYIMKGSTHFDISEKKEGTEIYRLGNLAYRELHYTFGKKNIPAFKDEEFITSENDYMISLNFQLSKIHFPQGGQKEIMSTWPALCNDFLKSDQFGKFLKDAEKEGKKMIPTLALPDKTEEEQIKIITNFVKRQYAWNNIYGRFVTKKLSSFMKEKTGNPADLNLFLAGLLKAAKIDAQPILLSTRDNGAVSESHPFESFFNYVIVRVGRGENARFLDATERLLTYNEIPSRCMNVRGLVIEPSSSEWINVLQDDLALTEKKFEISLNENNTVLHSKISYTAYTYDAYFYRRRFNGTEANLKELLKERSITPEGDIRIENSLELDKPFVFSFETLTPADTASGKLFIPPFLNQSVTENMFTRNERTLPVDLVYKHAHRYLTSIRIPEGYEVEHLPKTIDFDNKLMKIQYNATESNGIVHVVAEYQFKNSIYEAKSYGQLKALLNVIIQGFNEMIILKKRGTVY